MWLWHGDMLPNLCIHNLRTPETNIQVVDGFLPSAQQKDDLHRFRRCGAFEGITVLQSGPKLLQVNEAANHIGGDQHGSGTCKLKQP